MKIHGRGPNGNYLMPIEEIRDLVISGENILERIASYRNERIAVLNRGEGAVKAVYEPGHSLIVLHIIPFESFSSYGGGLINVSLKEVAEIIDLPRLGGLTSEYTYTLEGFAVFDASGTDNGYTHIHTNGIIEGVWNLAEPNNIWTLYPNRVEVELINKCSNYLEFLQNHGFVPPLVIMLSILEADRLTVASPTDFSMRPPGAGHFKGRKNLMFEPTFVSNDNQKIPVLMKGIFDSLWRAAGASGSPSYDEDGNWVP